MIRAMQPGDRIDDLMEGKTFVALEDNQIVGALVLSAPNQISQVTGDKEVQEELIAFTNKLFPWQISYQNTILPKEIKNTFTTYAQVDEFIHSQKDRVYSLDNFAHFMNEHGTIQDLLTTIHVCGTNGKGSTCNYINDVLMNASYKVGLFTSPALSTRLEIIQVNHQPIDEETFVSYCNYYMDEFLQYEISMFEIEMFLSILYFIEKNTDYCIYEVGLGGTLDATNIITPIVSVNTNISMDHMNYLGNTLESIAFNKAGIIKEGVPFITGEIKENCLQVFRDKCQEMHSEMYQIQPIEIKDAHSFIYQGYTLHLDMLGQYQIYNSALAIEVLTYLRREGLVDFTDEQMIEGIDHSHWAGRFEKISDNPLIIVDGAHNEDGMKQFYESAKHYDNIKIIFSALRDKDTTSMIDYLCKLSDDITVTEFEHPRADTAEHLAHGRNVKINKDYKSAIDECCLHDGVTFITGSLYFISKARAYVLEKSLK